ncbi:unnamed protein product [Arabidopsis arenosa]|uniref:Uncharacterized protein n=1 Tax=Arabidopsis arenosa TaxID=38785 RepID=A0A8S1ZC46_ARAAE|nr:unnamed protein product [Arabidopsis arenosa]
MILTASSCSGVAELANMTNLRVLNLGDNSFSFLSVQGLTDFRELEILDLSFNGVNDSEASSNRFSTAKLKTLDLSFNPFSDISLLKGLESLRELVVLKLRGNKFNHTLFTHVLKDLKKLQELDLSDNGFTNLDHGLGLVIPTSLQVLDFKRNQLSLTHEGEMLYRDLQTNETQGTGFEQQCFNKSTFLFGMSWLSYLYMSGNQLKGPFPFQQQSPWVEVMDISHNSFSGSIPRNVNFPSLRELRLQNNEFMGSVPGNLFNAAELEVLDLRNNNFSGKILNTIDQTSKLRILLLRNNSFRTYIPGKICQLSEVGLLDLSHNQFRGPIPSCFSKMSFGAEQNNGTMSLVADFDFAYITFLRHCHYASHLNLDDGVSNGYQPKPATVVDFLTKSRYEAYQGDILRYMHGLDLSSNELSGEIPIEIGDLQNIRSLDLSSNRLTGSIPDSIQKLKGLESLDLSNNKLYGSIPPMLADLNSLGYFNISYNNLSGEIPFKGHLVTFDERSYIGNAHLCGLPTNKNCISQRVPEPPSVSTQAKGEDNEEEGDVIDMVWFYWTCAAVYISTSLALFAFLCIDSRWSREWFYRVDLCVHHLLRFKRSSICN